MLFVGTILAVAADHAAEEVAQGGIAAIGLDPKALLFQLVNFALLFWVLKRVAYKPILKVLESRRQRIEESLKTAHEIELREKRLVESQAKLLHEAREAAGDIVAKARMQTAELLAESEVKAKAQASKIISDARGRIEHEVQLAKKDLKHEMSGLVAAATEAVLDEKVDARHDKALIERALAKAVK